MQKPNSERLNTEEVLQRCEVGCWMALAIAPITFWAQGSSVSFDQFIARSAIVAITVALCVSFRIRALVKLIRTTRLGSTEKPRISSSPNSGTGS